jgi:hypothetical protein
LLQFLSRSLKIADHLLQFSPFSQLYSLLK